MKFIAFSGFFAAIKSAWREYIALVSEGIDVEKKITDEEWWESQTGGW